VAQFFDWIGIAVIGGAIVGALSATIFNLVSMKCRQREPL
jgi:hypothetical protein